MLARKSDSIFEKEFDRLAWPNNEVRNLVDSLLQNEPHKRIFDTNTILKTQFFESQETRDYEEKIDKVLRQNEYLTRQVFQLTNRNKELEGLLAKAREDKITAVYGAARKSIDETLINSCEEKLVDTHI